jgi:pimeloyl-ACP methyl ester carboxylesterase
MEIRQRNLLRPEDLAKINARTLIVWGHDNPFSGVPEATAMNQNIKGSRLELFEACGNWPQHEHATPDARDCQHGQDVSLEHSATPLRASMRTDR